MQCSNVAQNEYCGTIGLDWVGCIADQYGQNGNISVDPLFCDTANGNYSLYNFSPCAAANNSCAQLIGAYDVGCTLAAVVSLPNEADSSRILSHTPTLSWAFDPAAGFLQSEFEIAVGTDDDWAYTEMWNPAPFVSADTQIVYAGAALIDGSTYFARVRTRLNGSWTPWFETSFRMNSLPPIPEAASPGNGATTDQQPTLFVVNGVDPEGDQPSYQFEVYTDPGAPAPVAASGLVAPTDDSTGWAVDVVLDDNRYYLWRARAFDGYEYSDWSLFRFFVVNTSPEPPGAPTVLAPVGENLILYDMLPEFAWSRVTDPDPLDQVHYRLELSLNEGFTMVVPFDDLADTVYRFVDSLAFNTRYWWRVKAEDGAGLFAASEPSDFWTWTLGDVNHNHACTISDISMMIDHLFISGGAIIPPKTGDVNGSCDITIGDISVMIDHLFITGGSFKPGCE